MFFSVRHLKIRILFFCWDGYPLSWWQTLPFQKKLSDIEVVVSLLLTRAVVKTPSLNRENNLMVNMSIIRCNYFFPFTSFIINKKTIFAESDVVWLESATIPGQCVCLSLPYDILFDICHNDGCKDSGREEDPFCRCHGSVRKDAWRTVWQEDLGEEEPREEETWCVHNLVQATGAEGSTRSSHSSGFFPRVRKHLAKVSPAAGYRYVNIKE